MFFGRPEIMKSYKIRNLPVPRQYDEATDEAFQMGGTWLSTGHTEALKLCQE